MPRVRERAVGLIERWLAMESTSSAALALKKSLITA